MMDIEYAVDLCQSWSDYHWLHRELEITNTVFETLDALYIIEEVRIGCPRCYPIGEQKCKSYGRLLTIFTGHSVCNRTGLYMFLK
jgi:hypothetical protein